MLHKTKIIFFSVLCSSFVHSIECVAPAVHKHFNIGRRVIPIKNTLIVEEELETTQRQGGTGVLWKTTAIYGITENIGVRYFLPIFLKRRVGDNVTRGLSDMSFEALFFKIFQPYNATIGSVGFFAPTGSTKKAPALGTSNFNLIFTGQWIHSSPNWYCAFLLRPVGAIQRKGIYSGSILNFEYLFGPKFELCNSKIPMAVLLEMDGAYRKPTTEHGIIVPNTGGTLVIAGPLISARVGSMIVQGRIQLPILQNYKGTQPHVKYLAALTAQCYF